MKIIVRKLLCVALSFMFVFSCVGYAAVSDSLQIFGNTKVSIPSGLFITNIKTNTFHNFRQISYNFLYPSHTYFDQKVKESIWTEKCF